MRAGAALAAMRGLPVQDFAAAFGEGRILVLAPHPDDESLGCGGLIAAACAEGRHPLVAILTDGTGSHPNSRDYPPERLRELREREALDATAKLGLPAEYVRFLRHTDTAAPNSGPALLDAAAEVAALIGAHACRTVVVSWRHDPHCDHAAAATIATLACRATGARLLAYPVWGWTLPPDQPLDEPPVRGFRLDIARHGERKRAAILAHRSQYAGIIQDDRDGFQLEPDFIDRFLTPTEVYVEMDLTQ